MFRRIQEPEQHGIHRQSWIMREVFWPSGFLIGQAPFYKQEEEDNTNINFLCSGYLCGVLYWDSILDFQAKIIQFCARPNIESHRLDNPFEDLKGRTLQSDRRFQPRQSTRSWKLRIGLQWLFTGVGSPTSALFQKAHFSIVPDNVVANPCNILETRLPYTKCKKGTVD